jgi:murein DD-endopeptidase MepM/ murein hydrolase activator NlpD
MSAENKSFFSEKEFIIRSGQHTRAFKISSKVQWFLFGMLLSISCWSAYSYQQYSVTGRIISYQEKKLDETRSAYVDLMSDFVTVHKNISTVMDNLNKEKDPNAEEMEDYLKKAEVIEGKIKRIASQEGWIDEEDLSKKNALKDAILRRDMAIEEKKLLEEKVANLEATISSLENFELDILKKVEHLTIKDMEKVRNSINAVNNELKKRGKYFNPLANSKKDNKGGVFVPDTLADYSNEKLIAQTQATFEAVDNRAYYQEAMKRVPLGKPVWTYWLTSPFGKRSDPFNTKSAVHKGVDLAAAKGNKIKTMAEGKVSEAKVMTGYGNVIEIDHGNGFKTKYAHLNKMYVKQGDKVNQGQAIGEVGSTGRSTGPHLHYEVIYEGVNVDPMVFIRAN